MSRFRQLGSAILFLVAVVLSHSGPVEGGQKTFPTTLNSTGIEWQTPEEMEEESNEEEMRMVGSEVAQRNQYPYMVALGIQRNGRVYTPCGGSIISRNQILTAAHCVTEKGSTKLNDPDNWVVLLGAHELSGRRKDAQQTIKVAKIKIHEKYIPRNYHNDIAILTLGHHIKFTKTISPVCLPPQGTTDSYDGREAYAKGWGDTKEGGTGSDFLRHAAKIIIPTGICRRIYNDTEYQDHMMCAYEYGKGICQGDSGGPLVVKSHHRRNCKYEQVGIISWIFGGCARKGFPGGYVRVTSFLPWIKMNT